MSNSAHIRLIVSDVDGVWTDGRIIYSGERTEIKEFHVRDGLAAKLAQHAGLAIVLLTSRSSASLARRARELAIIDVRQGVTNKLESLERIASDHNVTFAQILYVGDDLPDLAPMTRSGISAAPSDAAEEVLTAAQWKLAARGGAGAFRELVERLLRERGDWDRIIRGFTHGRPEAGSI